MSQQGASREHIFSQFITAIKASSPNKVEEILQHHDTSIVNQIEPQFRQPSLYFAALVPGDDDAAELIKLLIRNGANVKFKDHNQQTILFYICRQGKEKCAELLLSHGLSLDDLDIYGQTPMFYAVSENRFEIVRKYATKERVNHIDRLAQQTPIYYSARRGHFEMTKLLLEKGADLTYVDSTNKTVVEYAKKAKFLELADYLNSQLKKLKELNKASFSQELDKKGKKKNQAPKESRQTYKLVFCPEKGEPRDLTEEDVRQLLADKPELSNYMENPDSIPSEALTSVDNESWEKVALKIHTQCCKLKGAYYFMEPVDPVKFNIMDYFDIITQPMDLGTVKKKLTHNCYKYPQEFVTDMNLVWQNSYRYNGDAHVVSKCGKEIQAAFNNLLISQGLNHYLNQQNKSALQVEEAQPQEAPQSQVVPESEVVPRPDIEPESEVHQAEQIPQPEQREEEEVRNQNTPREQQEVKSPEQNMEPEQNPEPEADVEGNEE